MVGAIARVGRIVARLSSFGDFSYFGKVVLLREGGAGAVAEPVAVALAVVGLLLVID